MRTQIRKIGNSLGSIIPAVYVRQLELVEGSEIEVESKDGIIVIRPAKKKSKRLPFSESELLSGLDAHTAHGDELAAVSDKECGE